MTAACFRRGLAAGLLAGLLAGLFGYVVGEPVMDRAVQREEHARQGHERQVFGRAEQRVGLSLGTALYGTFAGGLFGLLYAAFWRRASLRGSWRRSLALAGAVFAGAVLLPFLKYPPSPPGVSYDPSALSGRIVAYLAMVLLGTLATVAAWRFARALEGAPSPLRALAGGAVLVSLGGFLHLAMPDFRVQAMGVPEDLLLSFRLASLGTQAVLWAAIGAVFGFFSSRRGEAA